MPPVRALPSPRDGRHTLQQLAACAGGLPNPVELRAQATTQPSLANTITSHGASDFAFPTVPGSAGFGWRQQKAALERARSDGAPLAVDGWVTAMHRSLVWKLACTERCFGAHLSAEASLRAEAHSASNSSPSSRSPSPLALFSAEAVHRALLGRYEREMVCGARPVLRRIAEGSCPPAVHMVLCVASVDTGHHAVELTDGWYCIWAACDEGLMAQLRRGRLFVGLKLRVWGGSFPAAALEERRKLLQAMAEPPPPWDERARGSAGTPRLELHANGVRRAAWHERLGLCRRPAFRVALDSLQPGGGAAPALHVLVARVLGPLVYERRADGSSRWMTLAEAQAAVEAARERAEANIAASVGEYEPRHPPDAGEDDGRDEPPRRSLVWRLTVVDAAPPGGIQSLDAATLASHPPHAEQVATEGKAEAAAAFQYGVSACATTSLWLDFGGGEDVCADGPLEGSTGWLLGAALRQVNRPEASGVLQLATSHAFASGVHPGVSPRCMSIEIPRFNRDGCGWVPDKHVSSRRSSVQRADERGGASDGAMLRAATLAARGLSRAYTPIDSFGGLPSGAVVDTVGLLVYLSPPSPEDAAWGGERESRRLFVVDEAMQLLCVRWVRSPSEPMPRLKGGAPICLFDVRLDFSHRDPWPSSAQLGEGLASLCEGPNRVVHHATAEQVGFLPSRISAKPPNSSCHHVRPRFDALARLSDPMRDLLSKCSGVALELSCGRLQAQPEPPPLSTARVPPACLAVATPSAKACALDAEQDEASPSSSFPLRTSQDTPRQEAVRTAILSLLRATPSGLAPAEIVGRCVAVGGDTQHPFTESEVAHALEVLTSAVLVYQRGNVFCSL